MSKPNHQGRQENRNGMHQPRHEAAAQPGFAAAKPDISFFFPAFDDAGTVEKLALAASAVLREVANQWEVIIVNDGSFDNTGEVADACARKYENIVVKHHRYNQGYGAALKTGFKTARYDLIFYTDGDMQYDPEELKLLLPLLRDDVAIVSGIKSKRADPWDRVVSAKIYNYVVRLFFRIHVRDVDAAFKLIRHEVLQNMELTSNGGFICAELFAKARQLGYQVVQHPVSHYQRTYGRSSAFNLLFILRSTLELMDLWWTIMARDKFFAARQNFWRRILWRKPSPLPEASPSAPNSWSSANPASKQQKSTKSSPV